MSTAYIRCPHCGEKMITHSHRQQTDLIKQLVGVCTNESCLFVANIHIEVFRQIHPSLTPNPQINVEKMAQRGERLAMIT